MAQGLDGTGSRRDRAGVADGRPKVHRQTCDDQKGADMPRKATEAAAPKKTAAKRPVTRRTTKTATTNPAVLTWEHVATRAYFIHLEDGGDPLENWLRAERELVAA